MPKQTNSKLLEQLAIDIESDNACPELREQANNLVLGDGNPSADIMFIGEAPGRKEDETGLPFVGASGRFLDEMLSSAGLDRKDVYITSIVKYRPPNNRDPSPDEKKQFWPYLIRQIEIIQPRVIITLGRHGGMCFIPDLVISRDHGQAQTITLEGKKYLVIPLYHPAAALYNGSMRKVLIEDFLTAKALVDNEISR